MRHIGSLPDQQQAELFKAYLRTLDIHAQAEPEDGEWAIWIHDEDQVEDGKRELAQFVESPGDEKYRQAAATAQRLREQEIKQLAQHRKRQVDVRQRWEQPFMQRCPVTFVLMLLSVAVTVLSSTWANPMQLGDRTEPLLTKLLIAPMHDHPGGGRVWHPARGLEDIRRGQIWRLVTPIFIHFSILHIVFNMLWLKEFGSAIEFRRGSLKFLLFVLVLAVLSNLGQYAALRMAGTAGPNFGGMSGVVYGLFGYIWMRSRFDPNSDFFIPPNLVFLLVAWFFLGLTGAIGHIANTAHAIGLVIGIVAGLLPLWWRGALAR